MDFQIVFTSEHVGGLGLVPFS